MPYKAINYENIHFYKIVCKDTCIKDCYVGHTTDFVSRKSNHKKSCNDCNSKHYDRYIYQFLRENGGWDNWDMILIETTKCENGLEARKKEREHIEQLNASLNIHKRPYISSEEAIQRRQQWRKDNPETVRKSICESHRRLKENHPERYKQYAHTNWENNKDKITKRAKEKVECECGASVSRGGLSDHRKTNKHQQYLQNQNNPQE